MKYDEMFETFVFKKQKDQKCTNILPNELEADCISDKEEEMEEDASESEAKKQTPPIPSQAGEDYSTSTKSSIKSDWPAKLPLTEEKKKYFEGIDLGVLCYPKATKMTKHLESKVFNLWGDGAALMEKFLHQHVETIEEEVNYVSQMTFNR